jgi:DNA mismatch repair protein MutH
MHEYICPKTEPKSEQELMQQAASIAGLTLGELATLNNIQTPENFKREKGWTGQLIELSLGAAAGSKSQQDFAALGIELKTIPIDHSFSPLETTYVCYAHLTDIAGVEWQTSSVKNKLQRVLWVPIDGTRTTPPKDRVIGTPFLWSPSAEQEKQLKMDWEELMDMIALGDVESITAKHGQFLQIRPKAANGQALTDAIGKSGKVIQTRPRGFYLRKDFTRQIIEQQF